MAYTVLERSQLFTSCQYFKSLSGTEDFALISYYVSCFAWAQWRIFEGGYKETRMSQRKSFSKLALSKHSETALWPAGVPQCSF